jgi:hypothetical protein
MMRALRAALAAWLAHGLLLAVLVGYAGGSRAVAVGPSLLLDEHAPALLVAGLVAAVVAFGIARQSLRPIEVLSSLAALAILDVATSFAAVAVVGELSLAAVPTAFVVVTGLGTQLLTAAIGGLSGASVGGSRSLTGRSGAAAPRVDTRDST